MRTYLPWPEQSTPMHKSSVVDGIPVGPSVRVSVGLSICLSADPSAGSSVAALGAVNDVIDCVNCDATVCSHVCDGDGASGYISQANRIL